MHPQHPGSCVLPGKGSLMLCRNSEPGELKCYSYTGTGGSNAHLIRSASVAITPLGHQADSLPVDPRIPARRPQRRERPGTDLEHRESPLLGESGPRPGKRQALVLDVGRFVRPSITPDDPDAVESAIVQAHPERTSNGPAPIV